MCSHRTRLPRCKHAKALSANLNRHCFPGCQHNPGSLFLYSWEEPIPRDLSCSFPANPASLQIICSYQDDLATQRKWDKNSWGQTRSAASHTCAKKPALIGQLTIDAKPASTIMRKSSHLALVEVKIHRVLVSTGRENCSVLIEHKASLQFS